ncbi:MAG: DNA adenine methylase [Deltaproteobacteria bacterium]|jgi:DNA adenine methylase|nr:DNA adenine methylase [Deltaproteobacteria bacterium]
MRPAVAYFEGKWRMAPWIISHFPPHNYYIEPFAGAASVLLRKPPVKMEIYNDLNRDEVNLFRILRDDATTDKLLRELIYTPDARAELELALEKADHDDPVIRA